MRRCLQVCALLFACVAPVAGQQEDFNTRPGLKQGYQAPQAEPQQPAEGKGAPVPAIIVAVAGTILTLAIICTPSRRA